MADRIKLFTGQSLKNLFNDNLRPKLAALGSIAKPGKQLLDDPVTVTLQVGKTVWEQAPRKMRIELWMSSLQRRGVGVAAAERYEDMLLTFVSEEAASDIEKDLARTFPNMKKFAAPEGQAALKRVLMAYAAYDPEVGYCQGMNFVAGLLLMYLPERHAFGGLVVLMQDRGLRKYYSTDMSLLQTHLWQLGRLMPQELCCHLESCGVLPLLYGASWLMTCFSADFPASFSARVMDVIMADKMDQALLKAAVGLLKHCERRLLGMTDMEQILALLKMELPGWDEDTLHDVLTDAFKNPWSHQQLQLLGSVKGAETVAEAIERVTKANLAAAEDSAAAAESAVSADGPANEAVAAVGDTAVCSAWRSLQGSQDLALPGQAADVTNGAIAAALSPKAAAAGPEARTPTAAAAAAAVEASSLLPPPPSVKARSSCGGNSACSSDADDTHYLIDMSSPQAARQPAVATALQGADATTCASTAAQMRVPASAYDPLAHNADWDPFGLSGHALSIGGRMGPVASGQLRPGSNSFSAGQGQQQQQQQYVVAPYGSSNHSASHQQQQESHCLRQGLQQLSFTQLSQQHAQQSDSGIKHQGKQQEQQQQSGFGQQQPTEQQQGSQSHKLQHSTGSMFKPFQSAPATPTQATSTDDWWDFQA